VTPAPEGVSRRRALARGWEHGFSPAGTRLLAVAATGYRGLIAAREWLYTHGWLNRRALDCPVVSIGNLTVGGTGKTPAVLLAAETLVELGHRPAVVSRGYRRRTRGVQVVADTASIKLDAEESGDEPFLLARRLPGVPVVVGANRYEAAELAVQRFHATAIVLDDAFQHRPLRRNLEIVMARARRPWGNERLLPAGPLREPLGALARADLLIATGARSVDDAAEVTDAAAVYAPGVPVLPARYVAAECWDARRMEPVKLETLSGMRVLAFAGIAFPDAFRSTLDEIGASVFDLVVFDDHHWYSAANLSDLAARAAREHADALVTTEKDWVRLRRFSGLAGRLLVLGVRLALVAGESEWRAAFERACPRR
jgi:tetraacyldisaccharide 4'-kinase